MRESHNSICGKATNKFAGKPQTSLRKSHNSALTFPAIRMRKSQHPDAENPTSRCPKRDIQMSKTGHPDVQNGTSRCPKMICPKGANKIAPKGQTRLHQRGNQEEVVKYRKILHLVAQKGQTNPTKGNKQIRPKGTNKSDQRDKLECTKRAV